MSGSGGEGEGKREGEELQNEDEVEVDGQEEEEVDSWLDSPRPTAPVSTMTAGLIGAESESTLW